MSYDKFAYYYDLLHADLDEDIPFLLAQAAETGGPILELGCGTGRLLRPFAHAGYNITGVDNSRSMVALAREHLLTEETAIIRERITLVEEDMLQLDLPPNSFALAIIPYNTLLHIREPQIRPLFRRLRSLLKTGGRLVVDMVSPAAIVDAPEVGELTFETALTDPQTGHEIQQWYRNKLMPSEQMYQISWLFREVAADEQPLNEISITIPYHYYYPHQLQMHLTSAGLTLLQLCGDYDGSLYNNESERLLLVAD